MGNDRAVSEVLGYALVFSLVVATVAIITVGGVDTLEGTRDFEQMNNAARAFDLLSSNMNDIVLREAPSRATEIRLSDAQLNVASPITVRFKRVHTNGTTTYNETDDVSPIVYRSSNIDSMVVYSAGTVFRVRNSNGFAVKEPSFVASDDRVIIPLIQTRSDSTQSIGGGQTARIRSKLEQRKILVSDTEGNTGDIYMNITSPRAEYWKDMLEDYEAFDGPDSDCMLDESGPSSTVSCWAHDPPSVQVVKMQVGVSLDT